MQADPSPRKPLRVWPGVVIVVLQWLARFVVPELAPEAGFQAVIGGVFGGGAAVVLWWVFFSRAPWFERLSAVVLMVAAVLATSRILHPSIGAGMMGMLFPLYAVPVLSLAFVVWAVVCRRLPDRPRRAAMVAAILLASGGWALLRTDGITGDGSAQFAWRWSETSEERLLAQAADDPPALRSPAVPGETGAGRPDPGRPDPGRPDPGRPDPDWPGFRGPGRDGVIRGVSIVTDWPASPPVELWRRPIGPGWSSFAVGGDLIYTQEQRGDDEVVACYRLTTGDPVWMHRDAIRFWESEGGAGPRATPTLNDGRVFAFGATGILNALDAGTGAVLWSRNAAADSGAEVQLYGFTSSPLVVGDLVVVYTDSLVAYDLATGEPRWLGSAAGESYGSPQLLTIDGVEQIVLLTGPGASSVAPANGTLLWEHSWPGNSRIVQPALTADGDLLIGSGIMTGMGMRRIAVARESGGWTTEERWTSIRLKPYFNDFVVHEGHAYGFDGRILACIDLADGEREWKGGRYGHGQVVLLADQDLLLVVSEKGELALVEAAPDQFTELARFPAVEGKTWNHPVLVGNRLLVRNGQEMAAFRLSLSQG